MKAANSSARRAAQGGVLARAPKTAAAMRLDKPESMNPSEVRRGMSLG
jgi:hypothetical protein